LFSPPCGVPTGSVNTDAVLSRFTDQGQISPWARDAVAWAVHNGLMDGTSATTFAPFGPVLRGELAALCHRFTVRFMPLAVLNNTATLLPRALLFEYELVS